MRLAEHWVDVKRRDAERLLTLIRDLADPLPAPDPPSFRLERSASFETLYANDRRVRHAGIDVPLRSIAAYAALHLGNFDELNFAALNRALVLVLANVLHVAPTAAEIEAESMPFRRRRGLETEALLATWLEAHGLAHESFVALMPEVATCRRLQRWLLVRDRGMHRTRWLLDELRLRDEYSDVASAAAQQRRVLEAWNPEAGGEALPDDVDLETLAADHHRSTAWRVDTALSDWAEEAGFATGQDLARSCCAPPGSANACGRRPALWPR
jgi:hypothetical protein